VSDRTDHGAALALGSGDLPVWYRDTEGVDPQDLDRALATLDPGERARAERFRFPVDRRDYVLAHDLLRRSLSRYAPLAPEQWVFDREPTGRPVLRVAPGVPGGAEMAVSLSHTRGAVACAVARATWLGVDVERVHPSIDIAEVSRLAFSSDEVAALEDLDAGDRLGRFVELWTLKEAYAKATGLGLSADLPAVTFTLDPRGALELSERTRADTSSPTSWQLALFAPAPELRLAVCVRVAGVEPWRIVARDHGAPERVLLPIRVSHPLPDAEGAQPRAR